MTPADLLARLRARGVVFRLVRPEPDRWSFTAVPERLLTPQEKKALKEHRDAIIEILWGEGDMAALRRAPAWTARPIDWRGVRGTYEEE